MTYQKVKALREVIEAFETKKSSTDPKIDNIKSNEKAQQLVQKHTNVSIEITARFAYAIEAALITAQECKQTAIFTDWWDNVIAELEKMKSNK